MLRITENFENGRTVRLRLDGTLSTVSYSDFAHILAAHEQAGGKIIIVDMAGVGFMDEESARKIALMQSEQVRIVNCSPFIETLLTTFENDRSADETLKHTDIFQKH
jgi:anti-anti-sigma regulatory factor